MRAAGGEWSKSDHEEVQTWKGNHVDGQLSQVGVELSWESETRRDTGHDGGDEVIQIAVRWVIEFECSHADIVKCLVVDTERLIRVLDQLMYGQGSVIWLNDGVGDLWRGQNREGGHHSIGVLFSNLGDKQSSHTGTGTSSKGVGDLESLKAVATLGLTSHDIENRVNELGTFSVVTFGPVVSSSGLTENKVVYQVLTRLSQIC